jgi:hypothetical protein
VVGLSGIVGSESFFQIGGLADIALLRMGNALEEIDVFHVSLLYP